MRMGGFIIVTERSGQLMLIIRLPDAGGQEGVGMPVLRIRGNGTAVITGLLAVTTTIDKNPAQFFITGCRSDPVVPAPIGRIVI